ncbi:hypothetical protein IOD16_00620 [Saccharothrix sp. 6-C]|uniref:hypothetical protein n=1 Tax=Saccharothrix sp. 6-C TaxID=2781735 RepID=UPI001916E7A3|nr:hypothetical protein [Saccharothrix sp. 6-C]QQQ77101.1 hypothetical protein IOD16_00620 [Saccharothrix sp. 6-C]
MSHREVPRSGRGCLAAVVVLPLAAVGGAAVLVLTFGQPAPPPSAQSPVTAHQTLVSVRTAVPPAALSPLVVVHPTSSSPPGASRSPEPAPTPTPTPSADRRADHEPQVAPTTSARDAGPRARGELPPTRSFPAPTTTTAEPTPTTAPPVTTTAPPVTTTAPSTGPAADPTTAEPTSAPPPP